MAFLTWPRFSRLESLDLADSRAGTGAVTNLLTLIYSLTSLLHLSLTQVNLTEVSPGLLRCGVAHCVSLSLARARLTSRQQEAVLLTSHSGLCPCDLSPHRPASLNLSHNDLSQVEPLSLAQGITAVLRVNVADSNLRPGQLEALFSLLSDLRTETSLGHLILRDVDLSTLNHVLLHDALHGIVTLNLQGSKLSPLQSSFVLRSLSPSAKLLSLNLSYSNLSTTPPDLLTAAAKRLQTLVLNWCQLSREQLTALLEVKNNSNKQLQLSLLGANFEGVPAGLLMKFQLTGCLNIFRRFVT